MAGTKQTEDRRPVTVITQDAWVDLSRKLLAKGRAGFSSDERATINGFINYVAPDVEEAQQDGNRIIVQK